MTRRTLIKRLRKVVAAFDADPTYCYVLQLPSGKTAAWSGAQMRDYFQAVSELMEANTRHDRQAQAEALSKLARLSANDDLPPEEIEAAWKLFSQGR